MTPDLRDFWRREPLAMKHALWPDFHFYDKQIEIVESVRDNFETIVPAGNQLGKDFVSGFIVLWFFMTHYRSDRSRNWCRVVTTSVNDEHLDVLWAEISRWASSANIPLTYERGGPLVITHHEIRNVHDLDLSGGNAGSYVIGKVSAKPEGLQGHHAESTLFVVDEASGVADIAYDMASTWAKRILAIGNPNPCQNFFRRGVKEGDILA